MPVTLHASPTDPTIRKIAAAVGYGGRKFKVTASERVNIGGTSWDGGSRDSYHVVRLSDGSRLPLPHFAPPQFGGPREDPVVTLEDDICVVRHSIFRGKDMGLTIFVHPRNLAPVLPSAGGGLTEDERAVLCGTKRFKSSYGGKDRRQMHNEELYACKHVRLTQDAWDAAKERLIAKGLLDKRGAITVEGRNVHEQETARERAERAAREQAEQEREPRENPDDEGAGGGADEGEGTGSRPLDTVLALAPEEGVYLDTASRLRAGLRVAAADVTGAVIAAQHELRWRNPEADQRVARSIKQAAGTVQGAVAAIHAARAQGRVTPDETRGMTELVGRARATLQQAHWALMRRASDAVMESKNAMQRCMARGDMAGWDRAQREHRQALAREFEFRGLMAGLR